MHSVSVDGGFAATGCGDGRARLWSLASFTCLFSLDHSVGLPLSSVRLLGSGLLVTGGEDRQVKVWSLAGGGGCVATLNHGAAVKGLAVSPAGFVASVGANGLTLWRAS